MFGKSYRLFKLLGFEVKANPTWLIIAGLIVWSLSSGLFPHYFEGLSTATYWYMGIAGALGLFLSIIMHELSHSLVARRFGLPIKGITLFIFGGVAEMNEEPPSAKAEFYMAIAGPIASIIIGGLFLAFNLVTDATLFPEPVHGVIYYLGFVNWLLAGFNLLPAFPLDGGRVLRSGLWAWKKNLRWATRLSSKIGSGFAIVLTVLGVLFFFAGNFIGGMWWVLIGMFLNGASKMSYQQLLMRRTLEGEQVERFMKHDPVTVSPSVCLDELVNDYVYKYHFKMFPVVDQSTLVGCVSTRQIKEVPKEEWNQHTVGELATACADDNTIAPDDDAMDALKIMKRHNNSRLMVTKDSHLVGVITLKDMLKFFALKVELED
ncbi:site-2 protease family protein [candidate division KSB1 bacterium]|nr:site-2 protease family protein [candidate division KSB1 bacterium]